MLIICFTSSWCSDFTIFFVTYGSGVWDICATLSRDRDGSIAWPAWSFVVVFITSPSTVYIDTSVKSSYYSQNDEDVQRLSQEREGLEDKVRLIEVLEHKCWLSFRTVLRDGEIEIQDLIAFIGNWFFHTQLLVPVIDISLLYLKSSVFQNHIYCFISWLFLSLAFHERTTFRKYSGW